MTVIVQMVRSFYVTPLEGESADDLDGHSDEVLRQLLALEADNLTDATVSVDLGAQTVEIEVLANADSFDEAVEVADGAIRAAIHAAGGSTPEWHGAGIRVDLVDA